MSYFTFLQAGTDAEVFLTQNGKPVPVCGLVGGTKENPKPVPELGDGYAVQEDNVMLEFNIPPASDSKAFSDSIGKMLNHITSEMQKRKLQIEYQSSMHFSPEQLQSEQARRFGCEPDYCVWTRSVNSIVRDTPTLESLRTAAAHLHVSYKYNDGAPEIYDQEMVVKMFDTMIGAPGIARWPDITRRALYGKCGAFRPKPYGIEYRVLGNEWIKTDEDRRWVFNRAQIALHMLNSYSENTIRAMFKTGSSGIHKAINEGNISWSDVFEENVLYFVKKKLANQDLIDEFYKLNPHPTQKKEIKAKSLGEWVQMNNTSFSGNVVTNEAKVTSL